ncbi:hypothetical protein [Vibrio sp. D431a]|uniref:hypothetical protein n=1 Tax=Vibrio sp. D431a TaxID=2837388 RepID=UPI002556DBCE|nr:hypothetical protein [Vibrio sp. D431a]MDK9790013.1 hypothetical protein [Vibrio sp. D431a]
MIKLVVYRDSEIYNDYISREDRENFIAKERFLNKNEDGIRSVVGIEELRKLTSVTLEQPEIGLHPVHHANVVKQICDLAEAVPNMKITVITHSKEIINLIGDYIEDKTRPWLKDVVSIDLLFRDEIVTAHYDDEGYLTNWPIGFFTGRINVT